MRKVKVVAALLCAMTPGVLGSYRLDGAYSAKVSGRLRNDLVLLAEPATAAASIETTIVTSTTKPVTTSAADTTTTAEEESTTTATEKLETEATTTETELSTTTFMTEPLVAAAPQTTAKTTAAVKKKTTAATTTVQTTTTTTAKTTSETDEDGTDQPDQSETTAETKPVRPITDAEYIMLCNVVGHEYGADWISEYDKALVVEVVMNRVRSPKFPNTIYGVLTQKNQFSGMKTYINLGTFSRKVTKSVKAAVDLYFAEPERFNHGYLYFEGDGKRNYFRTKY